MNLLKELLFITEAEDDDVAKFIDSVIHSEDGKELSAAQNDGDEQAALRVLKRHTRNQQIIDEALKRVFNLSEGVRRAFKRKDNTIDRQYRCTGGPKDGKVVASPQTCMKRKDPKKVRTGRKVARLKKAVRIRKSSITKNKAISKMVQRMNQRLQP